VQKACGELAERFREEAAPARISARVPWSDPDASGLWRLVPLHRLGGSRCAAACAVFVAVRRSAPAGMPLL
jgi:hypothetical protein